MPFPITPVIDSGVGANQNPRTGWTDGPDGGSYGGIQRLSNSLTPVVGPSWDYHSATGSVGPECEVRATITTIVAGTFSLDFRIQAVGTAGMDSYEIECGPSGSTIKLFRADNVVYTQLGADFSQAIAAGDSFGASAIGSTITAYFKTAAGAWTALGTRTDATYAGAGHLAFYTDAGAINDFGGGTLVREAPTPGGGAASGTAPAARAAGAAGGGTGGGTGPVARAVAASGGGLGSGTSPAARTATASGGATGAGTGPAARATTTTGGGTGGGIPVSVTVTATPTPGAAAGGGTAPGSSAPAGQGAGAGAGTGPVARVAVTPGGGLGGGTAPSDSTSVSETPTPGGGTGGGTPPTARIAETIAGGAGGGTGPVVRASVSSGGAAAAGTGPTPRVAATTAGAFGGGTAPTAWVTVAVGGAIVGVHAPTGAVVVVTPGGATAGGNGPSDGSVVVPARVRGRSRPSALIASGTSRRTDVSGEADDLVTVSGGVTI